MKTGMIHASVAAVILIVAAASPPAAPGSLGDVVREFDALDDGAWQANVCWAKGYLWEFSRKSWYLYQRSPSSGKVLGKIYLPSQEVCGVTWNSKRETWFITEAWDEFQSLDVLEIPEGGGDYISGFEPSNYGGDSGICYDAELDRLWITNNHAGKEYVGRFKADGTRDWKVTLSERERVMSIARAGDDLWIGDMIGEDADQYGLICKYTLSGKDTGVSFLLPGYRVPLSLGYDGRYLWAYGCGYARDKDNMIYQIDIEGEPGPDPDPIPPPATAEVEIIDYDGDGLSEPAVYRPSEGLWAIYGLTRLRFGDPTDVPVPADYDGDGKANPAVFRPQNGLWRIYPKGKAYFGQAGDDPCPGDFNGDGKADAGIFRDDLGLWAVLGGTRLRFGKQGDMPIYADFDMDGVSDIGIFRPSTGLWAVRGITWTYFGKAGDYPVPGDYLGRGRLQVAVYRPSEGVWLIQGYGAIDFGDKYCCPQAGDFAGNGRHNLVGFWGEFNGIWEGQGLGMVSFGEKGDIPVAARIYKTY